MLIAAHLVTWWVRMMNSLLVKMIPSKDQKNPPSIRPPTARQSRRKKRQSTSTTWTFLSSWCCWKIHQKCCPRVCYAKKWAALMYGKWRDFILIKGETVIRCKSENHVTSKTRWPFEGIGPHAVALEAGCAASTLGVVRSCVSGVGVFPAPFKKDKERRSERSGVVWRNLATLQRRVEGRLARKRLSKQHHSVRQVNLEKIPGDDPRTGLVRHP